MDILKIVLMIIFVIDCIALSAIILLQEGKSAGLGTISGAADSYWGQNKGRSMEGALVKSTKFLAILFLVRSLVGVGKFLTAPGGRNISKWFLHGVAPFSGFVPGGKQTAPCQE